MEVALRYLASCGSGQERVETAGAMLKWMRVVFQLNPASLGIVARQRVRAQWRLFEA